MTLQDAKKYVARFAAGENGPEEQATFLTWLRGSTVAEWNSVADEHEALVERWPVAAKSPSAEWISGLESRLDSVTVEDEREEAAVPVVEMGTRRVSGKKIWVAAASAAAVLVVGTILYTQHGKQTTESVQSIPKAAPVLAQTGNVPRGGQEQMILPDGSKVWINAASTLKFPTRFDGPERVVELSGEAYFEVVKDASKPFKIMIRGAEVDVLGTKLDVMAYEDEPVSKTTLVDGVVKMKSGSGEVRMNPGDQVQVNYPLPGAADRTTMEFIPNVKIEKVGSWRTGGLDFESADLGEVLRSMRRYYNVEIQNEKSLPVSKQITAGLVLQDGLRQNLNKLGPMFQLTFKTDGKTVTVVKH